MPIDGNRLDECLGAVLRAGCDDVFLRGRFADLRFLREIPGIRRLHLGEMHPTTDVAVLGELTSLESLFTANSPHAFDLRPLIGLRELAYSVKSGTLPPGVGSQLASIGLFHCSPRSGTLDGLPAWERLRTLHVCVGSLRSLEGVQRLPRLEHLRVVRLPKLEDVGALMHLPALRQLTIDDCKRAVDSNVLAKLSRLEILWVSARARMPSIAFMTELPNLCDVSLVHVDVVDGDLSALHGVPNATVQPFRAHYTPRDDAFRQRVRGMTWARAARGTPHSF